MYLFMILSELLLMLFCIVVLVLGLC